MKLYTTILTLFVLIFVSVQGQISSYIDNYYSGIRLNINKLNSLQQKIKFTLPSTIRFLDSAEDGPSPYYVDASSIYRTTGSNNVYTTKLDGYTLDIKDHNVELSLTLPPNSSSSGTIDTATIDTSVSLFMAFEHGANINKLAVTITQGDPSDPSIIITPVTITSTDRLIPFAEYVSIDVSTLSSSNKNIRTLDNITIHAVENEIGSFMLQIDVFNPVSTDDIFIISLTNDVQCLFGQARVSVTLDSQDKNIIKLTPGSTLTAIPLIELKCTGITITSPVEGLFDMMWGWSFSISAKGKDGVERESIFIGYDGNNSTFIYSLSYAAMSLVILAIVSLI